jgi:hypothetical protein
MAPKQLACVFPAGLLGPTSDSAPPAAWIFSNMKLIAVIGGAIAAGAIALMVGLAVVDCCVERSVHSKVAAE